MLPDRVSNPGPLTYESGALPIALRGPAKKKQNIFYDNKLNYLRFIPSLPLIANFSIKYFILSKLYTD